MANDQADAPKPFGCHLSEEIIEENKKLLAKIDCKRILLSPAVKGSLYFYSDIHHADNPSKEDLIDDPSALDSVSSELGIEIRNEDKHHRWAAQISEALKILEYATTYLKRKGLNSSKTFGANVELKWRDEMDHETILHLSRTKDNSEWQVKRYT